jgi:hypothetical protein
VLPVGDRAAVFHPDRSLRADCGAAAASRAFFGREHQFRPERLGFRVLAPAAPERATLEKNGGPDPGAVMDGIGLNVENARFLAHAFSSEMLLTEIFYCKEAGISIRVLRSIHYLCVNHSFSSLSLSLSSSLSLFWLFSVMKKPFALSPFSPFHEVKLSHRKKDGSPPFFPV